jgi:hypothetical protein
MASELKVDTISEKTSANGVTIDGVLIKDSAINASSVSGINRKNYLINGNFDVWQRGTSETGRTSSGYAADRWMINPSGGSVDSSRETFTVGQTDVPNNPEYFYRFENTVANDNVGLWQKIEGVETFSGQTITLSFYAKYTTNKPTNLFIDINQDFGSSGSSDVSTSVFDDTNPYTTSWQKFTYTVNVPSISGKTIGTGDNIAIRFGNRTNETFDFDIAQVQVEVGSVATDFEYRHIGEELALCHRYYQYSNTGSRYVINGSLQSSTDFRCFIPLHTEMRAIPTVTLGASPVVASNGAYDNNGVTLTGNAQIAGGLASAFSVAATSGTFSSFQQASMRINTLEFDAEL